MNNPSISITKWVLFACLLTGCALSAREEHIPQLSLTEVVAIANDAAVKEGVNLKNFHAPEAHFEYVEKDYRWFVHYEGIGTTVGNHFGIFIDDRTRRAEVGVGM